jgi:hypothetical protein
VTLAVGDYGAAETEAVSRLPNRVIEAAQAETFLRRGYPTRAAADAEVWRYLDSMHELGERADYGKTLGGATEEEYALLEHITRCVVAFSSRRYGRAVVPKGPLVRALLAFRHIRTLLEPDAGAVFEIGAGSGYLGALLGLAGYRYVGTDITQGFYMAQSHLWEALFGDRFIELAHDSRDLASWESLPPQAVIHVPWWKYYAVEPERQIRLRADLVTANHTLCEMHTSAFNYTLEVARSMLGGPDRVKCFFVEGPGADQVRGYDMMLAGFGAHGYRHLYSARPVDVFVPSSHGEHAMEPPPSAPPAAIEGPVSLERSIARRLKQLAARPDVPAPQVRPPISKVQARIEGGMAAIAAKPRRPYDDLHALRVALVGDEGTLSEDEKFMRYAYSGDEWR